LELDSVYGLPAPRQDPPPNGNRKKMKIGEPTALGGTSIPLLRPPGTTADNNHDLPREPPSVDVVHDRAALIGDPRNDENTIIAQLHVAFLRAHNKLVDQHNNFRKAKRILRQHYQHIVLHDFLKKRVADEQIVDDIIENGNQVYDPDDDDFFMPLEYSVAAYRFGHSMVRGRYDFNVNFNNNSGFPATLARLFTFTALSGQLGDQQTGEFPTLPENWIIQWKNLIDAGTGNSFNKARRIDTELVEPLDHLRILSGQEEGGLAARLAVRNLLRGYLLRLPTGQAVAHALGIDVLTPDEITQGAAGEAEVQALQDGGFLERTPLWYYILAEAAVRADGQHLGPVGSTIVAEVLVGLIRRSPNSILRQRNWEPNLPSQQPGTFTLADLLRFAGVLN